MAFVLSKALLNTIHLGCCNLAAQRRKEA